ncbi:MAG: hypothetical protein LBT96_05405 [Campylobacteraceae bacterium]|jgi:hypothetical protein|nr:hypothetical protein [Campylobacteraceae bacterium]
MYYLKGKDKMENLYYSVIKKDISNGLKDEETGLIGDGNYLILQYAPAEANVRIRLNNNFNPQIKLMQNSGIEAKNTKKIYISADAVQGGEIIFLHAKTSEQFRYIPPTFGKIDVGTVDLIKQFSEDAELNVKFSDSFLHNLCKIVNPYEYAGIDFYAFNTEETSFNTLSKAIEYENCEYDKLHFKMILYPYFQKDSSGNDNIQEYDNMRPFIEILFDDSVVYSSMFDIETYTATSNQGEFTIENCLGHNIKVNLLNKYASNSDEYIEDIRVNVYKYNYKASCINDYANDIDTIAREDSEGNPQGSDFTGSKDSKPLPTYPYEVYYDSELQNFENSKLYPVNTDELVEEFWNKFEKWKDNNYFLTYHDAGLAPDGMGYGEYIKKNKINYYENHEIFGHTWEKVIEAESAIPNRKIYLLANPTPEVDINELPNYFIENGMDYHSNRYYFYFDTGDFDNEEDDSYIFNFVYMTLYKPYEAE